MKDFSRGFTLIELLVVIAIIGMLAAVVLASVGTARNKGANAAIEEVLSNARTQGELYGTNHGNSYTGVCAASSASGGVADMVVNAATSTGAAIATGAAGAYNQVTCNDSPAAWALEAPLTGSTSGSPNFWCVDSSGTSRNIVTPLPSGSTYACPTS
jgi:prepilin-type N-terminal cleavage/methylation domain-containing protein